MYRRRLLATASGALALFAGCSGSATPDASTSSDPDESVASTSQSTTDATTATSSAPDGDPEISSASAAAENLAVGELSPVDGPNVNLGATGTATNDSGRWLTDCELVVTGEIGDETFTATAARNWLAPHRDWAWTIPFGEDAAGAGDEVEILSVEKRASYWQ